MRLDCLVAAAFVGVASGSSLMPRAFSVSPQNGFPNPNKQQEMTIALQAGGKLPNGPPPKQLGDGSTTAFQLIAFNELWESAYFATLVNNITSGAFKAPAGALTEIRAVLAQEEQHALGAIGTLKSAGKFAPTPCKYMAPVTNFMQAITLAETFTAVVLGALQDANVLFTKDGAQDPVRQISSVIGQEGEQNGYFRYLLGRIPSGSPFLTTVPGAFAYSALQNFVVPGSCPYPLSKINLPIFPTIMTNGGPIATIPPKDQVLSFSVDLSKAPNGKKYLNSSGKGLFLTYTTGQQVPFSFPIRDVKIRGSVICFKAPFPYEEYVMAGFSHAAITTVGKFSDADSVVDSALAGPAVIQVDNQLGQ